VNQCGSFHLICSDRWNSLLMTSFKTKVFQHTVMNINELGSPLSLWAKRLLRSLNEIKRYRFRYNGIIVASSCKGVGSLFISLPHFLHTKPYANRAINGLSPSLLKHGSLIEIEPITGILHNAAIKMQFSFEVESLNLIK